MFFTHLPDMPAEMSDEAIEESNLWLQENARLELWTTRDIETRYKISASRLNQIQKIYKIKGHIQLGSTHIYVARYAKEFFEDYVARQIARISTRQAKKSKDKKVKKIEEWRKYSFNGAEMVIPDKYKSRVKFFEDEMKKGRNWCFSQGHNVGSEVWETQYMPYRLALAEALEIDLSSKGRIV